MSIPIWVLITLLRHFAFSKDENKLFSENDVLPIQINHGEGNFKFAESITSNLDQQAVMAYVDENGNEQIIFQTTSSAVNQFDITNAATGNSPEISATGDDTNISLKITPKGTGQVIIDGNVGVESGVIDFDSETALWKRSGSPSIKSAL